MDCTATGVFAALRTQVVKDAARMNSREPGRYLPSDESFNPTTHRFEIHTESLDGAIVARVTFDLGHRSITVKQQEGDKVPVDAFRVVPDWDGNARRCRLSFYGEQGGFGGVEDPDLETVSRLALEML